MIVDSSIWGAGTEITGFPNTMKFADTFKALAQAGKIRPDVYPDESIYQNYCTNDALCISRYIRIDHVRGETLDINSEFYHPQVSNYFPAYTTDYGGAGNSAFCDAFSACYTGSRFGMQGTNALMPPTRPCTAMATEYFVLCVMCTVVTFSSEDTYCGVRNFNVTSEEDMTYAEALDLIDNDENFWETHYVSKMWVKAYYGTRTNRATDVNYLGVGVSRFPKIPATSFVDSEYVYEGDYNKQILLMPYSDTSCYQVQNQKCLQQGGTWYDEAKIDKIRIVYAARCNPSFWSLGVRNMPDGHYVWLTSYINDTLSFTSAFYAYCATGFKFTGSDTIAQSGDADDPELWMRGKPGEGGGIDGHQNADDDEININLVDDPDNYGDNGFNGNSDVVDTNNYVDETPLTTPNLSVLGAFNRTFAVSYTNIKDLADWLWNADEDVFDEIIKGLGLHGENPIEGIIDVRLYPFAVNTLLNTTTLDDIIIGRTNSGVQGYPVAADSLAIVNLGKCSFFAQNKNFLDYKPYTEARLYIPYIGIIPIDTAEFMGHEISVKMIVDFVTGACAAMVYKDGIICLYSSGTIGVSIPFSGTNSAAFANSVLSGLIGGTADVITGAMTGNAGQAVAGAAKAIYSEFNTATQYQSGGSSTPNCGNWEPQYCYFIIDRPIPIVPENYGHFIGYACEITGALTSFSGFTVIGAPVLDSIGATDTEKDMIRTLMQEGIYL